MIVLGAGRFIAIAVTVFVVWRIICWRRNGAHAPREAVVVVLFAWSLVVAYLTFFPMRIIFYDWHGTVSLIPFASIMNLLRYSTALTALKNIAGNVLLFVPFGLLLPLLFERLRKPWPLLWRAAVISGAIEVGQLPTRVRATDVDDVILNVVGAMVGLLIFRLIWVLAGRASHPAALLRRLGSTSRREPLLAGFVPVVFVLVLTVAALAPTVVSHTLNDADVIRSSIADLPQGSVAARSDVDGYAFILARGFQDGSETLRFTEFKRVLPGRFTLTATGDILAVRDSGYAWSLTAYDTSHGEKPTVYAWGRNEAAATSLDVTVSGRSPERSFAVGKYFVVAFPYDPSFDSEGDGAVNHLSFEFLDSWGRDVTDQFARW